MLIIDPSYEILHESISPKIIELAGRTCYKSEDKITDDTANDFVAMIMRRGHESVLEHSMLTVKFITNRGVTHEIVRHRLCAFSQESTRYVNYEKKGCVFIRPVWCSESLLGSWGLATTNYLPGADISWLEAMSRSEQTYLHLLEIGWRYEQAREVLPNSLKTEIVVTANAREWRHIFKMRTADAAHPEMRRLMCPLLDELKTKEYGVLFGDIGY